METDCRNLWNNCLNVIRDNISEPAFNTWFAPILPLKYEENVLTVQVPSQFFYEYLEDKYLDLIQQTLYREIGEGTILNYRILVETQSNTAVELRGESKYVAGNNALPKKISAKVPSPFDRVETAEFDSQINNKYTFANFFEGESNRLARTAAEAVAANPAKTAFNPLFVHGHSGVGKTHLCHAIGSKIKQLYPDKKLLYISAHLFKVQFTDARRFNTINDFINFYQSIDVLIIDDIQELSGLGKTQNTFFHIFNHLHQNNKQLVMTSDCAPMDMQGMEERLLTRFRWGLTTQLDRPDKELRKKILQQKILADGLSIPDNVIEYIAENVTENVRDLEGIVVSLMAHSIINNRDIDMSLARRVLEQSIKFEKKRITVEKIQDTVSDFFNVKKDLIQSKSRKREIVQARQVTMFFIKKHTELSLSQIGVHVGNRNHATVLHACSTVKDLAEVDRGFRSDIEEIERLLQS
ncbi:MAG TPA: chromosomal replication initiator protein DnaA [Porphyromonadaceae bacterium]|jgi:chromosomal replication initiator protein|uniref:chromosomal replication initiator protein DnaA n=1 Tax=Limibacterium fermenti TaxID=3229863 RepID=UPI000E80B97E|nr:chromosomal replication initiator protein DnaA [Porphyromonadaceae bacterium]HBK33266.1 chromosomal replication initiator protein DnaA [Porphyromonadaceae bacterium]HBL32317.1 chromosomal replication initiator protein DnaA [Porphyromonadaceae bacterium]HBX21018.1 chromosomal replication initiator protein DnaA [Porphyromonadaceae bacterium]HCM19838.1 chromosomal replication initiator protein DnaA [Porphyromonadaceae bacterium]